MPKESSLGYQRSVIPLTLTGAALGGTGALTLLDSWAPGFRFSIEKVVAVVTDTLAGAGGVQTFKVRRGGPTGTVVATVAPAIAGAAIGTVTQGAVTPANEDNARVGSDTGTLSVTRDASGTAFSAGTVMLYVVIRQRDQARK